MKIEIKEHRKTVLKGKNVKFNKKDYVLVKDTFIGGEISFSGFGGRIQRIFKNGAIQVVWDSISLNKFTDDYIKKMIENDYYLFDYNFSEHDIYLSDARDIPEMVYEAQEKIYNKKLSLSKNKIPEIEEYYDRFTFSPFYEKFSDIQKDKSWNIIDIFSSIMLNQFSLLPVDWNIYEFEQAYINDFQQNVVASKAFYKNSKRVLMQYLKFLNKKGFCNTIKIQDFLNKQ